MSLQDIYSFMPSKGYDYLTSGHMTRKCRNRLECLTCCRSHHSVFQDAKFTNNKSIFALLLRLLIDQTTVRHFTDSSISVLAMILGAVAIKAEGQESLCYHIHSTVKAAYENVSAFLSFLNIYNKTVASVLIFTDFEFKVCK